MKKFVQSPISVQWREDEGNPRVASNRTLSRVKREVVRNPCLTCRELIKRVGRENVSKITRCRLLKKVANNLKPVIRKAPLKAVQKQETEIGRSIHQDRFFDSSVH